MLRLAEEQCIRSLSFQPRMKQQLIKLLGL